MTLDARSGKHFVSLRWRIAGLLALILVGVSLLTQIGYYLRLKSDQRAAWARQIDNLQRSFLALDRQSSLQLQRLASQFANEYDELVATGQPEMPEADLFSDIDALQFLTRDGMSLFAWEQEGSESLPSPALVRRALASIRDSDTPVALIDCSRSCLQHAFVPLVSGQGRTFVVGISRSGSDTFVGFQQVLGADIVLLSHSGPAAGTGRQLWGRRVSLLTHADVLGGKLDALARETTLESLYRGRTLWVGGDFLAVKAFDLPAGVAQGRITVLLIDDDTESLLSLRRAMLENVVLGVVGMLLAAGGMILALRRPMRRLGVLSETLPELAENRYAEVRERVAGQTGTSAHVVDEIDVLASATGELTDRLETLQSEVARHDRTLRVQLEAIERERAFNELLLDTAPVVIALHRFDGRVVHMNRYGLELTGWAQDNLCQMQVEQLIEPPRHGKDPLQYLRGGDMRAHRVESELRCAHGTPRRVTWVHTVIDHEQGRLILSVGLDMTLQRQTESRLHWLVSHDSVTGLLNRDSFAMRLQNQLESPNRAASGAALMMIDIDSFRDVNDSFGTHGGDQALAQFSQRIQALCGDAAFTGRLGSDEFGVVLEGAGADAAFALARTIEQDLLDRALEVEGRPLHLTVTTGIVLYPAHGEDSVELLASMALAQAQARRLTPGHAHVFEIDTEVRALRRARMRIRDDIAEALAENRFILHYQPLFDLQQRRIGHYEALVRMRARDGRIVPPGEFIGVAESTGQIAAIQNVVLRLAIRRQAELTEAGHPLGISINLSARTFEDPTLLEQVRTQLAETGANPGSLIFEIVESEAIANLGTAQQVATELTRLGARFAFDDFGVGFTSFEYLRELPVDIVKIDQSFVRDLRHKEADRVLVRSMNDMIQRLGLKSVAEGVEDAWTLAFLRDIGVDYAQGYFVSRPLPDPLVGADAEMLERRVITEAYELEALAG